MKQDLAVRVLSQIMSWSDERARKELEWLRLIARLKYDGYRDFQAGMRFIESLATWLQQFDESSERETAYQFVRESLIFVTFSEMKHLVEQFYPRTVRRRLHSIVASQLHIPPYRVLAEAQSECEQLLRQTLFVGLSDGARLDLIRHVNAGVLRHEQFVPSPQADAEKWKDLLGKLRRDLADHNSRFRILYLIDDFAGTGTSLIRYDEVRREWKGKLVRFKDSIRNAREEIGEMFESNWELCIHHYLASAIAENGIRSRVEKASIDFKKEWERWASRTHVTFGSVLPKNFSLDQMPEKHERFIELTNKYYDPSLRTEHTDVGGVPHMRLGYGGCALPLVLEHNTPNNAVSLLWADTDGGERNGTIARAMKPLFRRNQRHV